MKFIRTTPAKTKIINKQHANYPSSAATVSIVSFRLIFNKNEEVFFFKTLFYVTLVENRSEGQGGTKLFFCKGISKNE